MPLYLLAALVASLIPVGAVAIKKATSSAGTTGAINGSPLFGSDGSLIVPVGRYAQKQPDTLTTLALVAGGFYLAKKMKVV